MRRLELAAQFPVLVHAVQPIREPAGADFKKGQTQLGKAHRDSLKNNAGEVQEDADRECVGVHLGEGSERARADLGRRAAVAVDGKRHVEALGLFIEGVIHRIAERRGQSHGKQLEAHQAQFSNAPAELLGRFIDLSGNFADAVVRSKSALYSLAK
jgi:hypothetical protein